MRGVTGDAAGFHLQLVRDKTNLVDPELRSFGLRPRNRRGHGQVVKACWVKVGVSGDEVVERELTLGPWPGRATRLIFVEYGRCLGTIVRLQFELPLLGRGCRTETDSDGAITAEV